MPAPRNIVIGKDADAVIVKRGTKHIYHVCCDCGARHRVEFEWPREGVLMRWKLVRRTANPAGLRSPRFGGDKQDPVVGQPELTK